MAEEGKIRGQYDEQPAERKDSFPVVDLGVRFRLQDKRHAKLWAILQEVSVKFMNFSRNNVPNIVRLGSIFGNTCFDITKAIGDDLLEFPSVVFSIEDVLQVKDGLTMLVDQLRDLKRSSSGIQSFLFSESDVTLRAPITHPQKVIGIG